MNRTPEPWLSNNAQAHRAAREYLKFIMANVDKLRPNDRGGKMEKAARDFNDLLQRGEKLTGPQLSFIDSIYEKTMASLGMPAVEHITRYRRLPR